MKIDPLTYNALLYYSTMYGIECNNKALFNLLPLYRGGKIDEDIVRDILCECRARGSNPKIQKFYNELLKSIDYDEYRKGDTIES